MTITIAPGVSTYTITASNTIFSNAGTRGSLGGSADGIFLNASHDTVVNSGTILGGAGAYAFGTNFGETGNRLTNLSGGLIESAGSVDAVGFASNANAYSGYVFNAGIINTQGGRGNAIGLFGGGTVVNTGTLSGGGIYAEYGSATVTNSGSILGNTIYGAVYLKKGGLVTNMLGGTIAGLSGSYGVKILGAAGTVTNAGSISGGAGDAISLSSAYTTNRVILDPGAKFTGIVDGGNKAALELHSNVSTGTVTGFGVSFTNFGSVIFDAGSKWLVAGNSAGVTPTTFYNFNSGDTINVTGFTATSVTTIAGNKSFVLNGASSQVTIHFAASVSSIGFTTGAFGTDLTGVCFCAGTNIAVPDGEVPVEQLKQGDIVLTAHNGPRAITWIGQRRIDLTAHPRPELIAPIRIQRSAFADGVPHADLLVSPDHGIFVDGKLICARQLINGTTIRQEMNRQSIEYFHIELDAHAILFAEGLTTESYLDTGNRGFFTNSEAALVLHPDLMDDVSNPTRVASSCAPFVCDAANVLPVWQRLADRASALGNPVARPDTSTEPELHLLIDGRRIQPIRGGAGRVTFVLQGGSTDVRLVSRAGLPTNARPWLDDRRRLGVRVARILMRHGTVVYDIPLDLPALREGWWAVEQDGVSISRWTNGEAVLPLPVFSGPAVLEIHMGGEMTYVVETAIKALSTRTREAA